MLSERDLVPEIWLPDPRVRREREQARFRMHLVKHRIHATLITFGHPCPVIDSRQRLQLRQGKRTLRVWA